MGIPFMPSGMAPQAIVAANATKIFKYVDTDKDGKLDQDELVRRRRPPAQTYPSRNSQCVTPPSLPALSHTASASQL